jgi:hypothetical protein
VALHSWSSAMDPEGVWRGCGCDQTRNLKSATTSCQLREQCEHEFSDGDGGDGADHDDSGNDARLAVRAIVKRLTY